MNYVKRLDEEKNSLAYCHKCILVYIINPESVKFHEKCRPKHIKRNKKKDPEI